MKNFIVPVDFSGESLNGLKMALLFSNYVPVDIEMIHVITKGDDPTESENEQEHNKARDQFENILKDHFPSLGKDSKLTYRVETGKIFQVIVNRAQMNPESVICASTHGASGFQEFFIGSNAYHIISATESPVITLRKNKCPENISKIVIPIDHTSDTRQKVPFTSEIARLFNAQVHILGVHTSRSQDSIRKTRMYISQVSAYMENKLECTVNEVHGDSTSDLVVNYSVAINADLISITTDRSAGISLIMGNAAHQILNKSECPVLCQTPKNIRRAGTFVTTGG
jgi:nucleotide-binding universal stress UspA family protein